MTGDISARRGALPKKNQRRLTTVEMVNGFELFKRAGQGYQRQRAPLHNPPQLARFGNCSLKCFYHQRLVVSFGALA